MTDILTSQFIHLRRRLQRKHPVMGVLQCSQQWKLRLRSPIQSDLHRRPIMAFLHPRRRNRLTRRHRNSTSNICLPNSISHGRVFSRIKCSTSRNMYTPSLTPPHNRRSSSHRRRRSPRRPHHHSMHHLARPPLTPSPATPKRESTTPQRKSRLPRRKATATTTAAPTTANV